MDVCPTVHGPISLDQGVQPAEAVERPEGNELDEGGPCEQLPKTEN